MLDSEMVSVLLSVHPLAHVQDFLPLGAVVKCKEQQQESNWHSSVQSKTTEITAAHQYSIIKNYLSVPL